MNTTPPESLSFPVTLQRNSFGPRLTARAGDVWRAFQEIAVVASTAAGWPPSRYREGISAAMEDIVKTAMNKDVARRYQDSTGREADQADAEAGGLYRRDGRRPVQARRLSLLSYLDTAGICEAALMR